MRACLYIFLLFAAFQLRAQPGAPEPQPLPTMTVGEKTFERVSLIAVKGGTITISHAFGVKDLAIEQLTPEQIEQLNGTSTKVKIEQPKAPEPPAPATNGMNAVELPPSAAAPMTNTPAAPPQPEAEPEEPEEPEDAQEQTEAPTAATPLASQPAVNRPPGFDPAALMIKQFQELAAEKPK